MRVITRSYKSITRSYRREREGIGEKERELERKRGYRSITRSYKRERKGVGTIGLD